MASVYDIWLSSMTLSAIISAMLIINLFKNDNILSKILVGFLKYTRSSLIVIFYGIIILCCMMPEYIIQ
jgi:hypothetical protein